MNSIYSQCSLYLIIISIILLEIMNNQGQIVIYQVY